MFHADTSCDTLSHAGACARMKCEKNALCEGVRSAWSGLVWSGLAWLGLAWLGLAWLGLAWPGLAWPGLAKVERSGVGWCGRDGGGGGGEEERCAPPRHCAVNTSHTHNVRFSESQDISMLVTVQFNHLQLRHLAALPTQTLQKKTKMCERGCVQWCCYQKQTVA